MAGREYGSLADILYRQLSNETTTEPPKEPVPIPRLSTNAIAAHADSETTENITVQTDIPEFSKPEAPNITAPVIKIDDNESAETITPHVTTPQIPEVKPIKKVRLPEYRMQTLTDPKPVFKAAQKAYSTQSLPDRLRQFQEIVDQAAEKYNIDRNLIFAVIAQESYGNPNDVSSKGAKGLMQLMDETATDMGVRNVMDPRENVMGGTKYLSQLLSQYDGDLELTLAGYNAGPGNVRKYGGIPPFQETQQYVKKVLAYYKQFKGTTSL
ncbi:lytic transglycosylase domain-containing protein [candidate division KSB1 bacterium]|nr:lytic transglycosylase domain-containing protein [candidate division KSB1 bacterium]